tara:strand:- start:84 stop:2537 length:2454 start_codon:yes stop_codon:yes gene_type:complete
MDQNLFRNKQTDLDLNGPNLSFTTNPSNQEGNTGDNVSFIGIATATFPNAADNSGSIAYQWYEVGVGKLSDGGKLAGTATTTLTLSNLVTPGDNGRQFYVESDYVPFLIGNPNEKYYQTGNALNEPLNSGIGSVTVADEIAITTQPIPITGIIATSHTFNVASNVNGDTQNLSYQWQVDGTNVSNGTIEKKSVEVVGINTIVTEQTFTTGSFTIPANATNIRLDLGGGCGGQGANTHLNIGGDGGDGMTAWFTIPSSSSARTVSIDVGRNGNDGLVGTESIGGFGGAIVGSALAGGNGAKSGSTGLNGSGGGGGAPTSVTIDGTLAIVLGGGAGGGGASESGAGTNGGDAGPTSGSVIFYGLSDSDSFSSVNGISAVASTGAGGGGGGSGASFTYNSTTYSAATAGTSGSSATGGEYGYSAYKTSLATLDGGSYNRYEKSRGAGSGWAFLTYTTTSTTNTNDTKTTTVTGAQTASLTLNTDKVGVAYTVGVVVSATASNSPLTSDIVGYTVVSETDQAIVNIEAIGITTSASLSAVNLRNGEITFTSSDPRTDNTNSVREYVLYSPERNINVEMEMYGGKGYDNFTNGTSFGGQGGYGKIQFTLEKNVEYVLTGLSTSIGAPSLYRKASLLAVVGQGGKGGQQGGVGGRGGGPNMAGQSGGGNGGGGSSANYAPQVNGTFGSIFQSPTLYTNDGQAVPPNGGLMISCPKGIYWAQQGKTQCEDLGSVQFRLSDGSIVSNTSSSITRGYKTGYNIIETAGAAIGNGGIGGNGASGGSGGQIQGGGGGGSGFASGSVTVVDSTLGGNQFNEPRVILRVV